MKFQVPTVVSMKMRVFWDVMLYSFIETDEVSEVCTASTTRVMIIPTSHTTVIFNKTKNCVLK
jgi:hypothetical protein